MFRKSFFCFSRNSEVCSNWSGSFYTESEWFARHFGCLKNTPHSLKGDFGDMMHKNFSFSEKSAHYSKRKRCICLCGRCVSASTQCGYWLFCVLEKISPHSSKGKIEWCVGKNLGLFKKISSLPKSGKTSLCR